VYVQLVMDMDRIETARDRAWLEPTLHSGRVRAEEAGRALLVLGHCQSSIFPILLLGGGCLVEAGDGYAHTCTHYHHPSQGRKLYVYVEQAHAGSAHVHH
jgi:hypothetical protein